MAGHLSLGMPGSGPYGCGEEFALSRILVSEEQRFTMSEPEKWELTVARPDGMVGVTLVLAISGNVVTGTSTRSDGLTTDILNGVFDGTTLSYDIEIQEPTFVGLHFDLAVSGDTMSGTFTSAQIGDGKATGRRI